MKNLKKFKLFEQELLEKEGLRKDAIHVKFKKDGKEYPGMVYGVNNDKKTASIYSDSFDKELEVPLEDVIDGLKEDHIPYNQAVLDVYIKFREQGKKHGEAVEAAAQELKLTYEDVEGEVNKASDDETWIDPAGGEHSRDEEDPAKMYESILDGGPDYKGPKEDEMFTNLGYDEEGRLIGNCKKCSGTGVDVESHRKTHQEKTNEAETHTYKVPNNAVKVPKGDTGFDLVKKHYRRFIWTWNQYADKKPNITND